MPLRNLLGGDHGLPTGSRSLVALRRISLRADMGNVSKVTEAVCRFVEPFGNLGDGKKEVSGSKRVTPEVG